MIPVEELANGTSRRADGGRNSSSSHSRATTITQDTLEVEIDVGMETSRTAQLYPKYCMEKVPLIMRRDEKTKGYFDPKLVSVGPYHHGKEELQMAEKIKPIVAQLFISNSGRDMAEFRLKILEIVDDVRSCYLEGSTDKFSDEEFAEMMLLDGLFVSAVIESIAPFYEGPRMNQKEFKKHLGEHALHVIVTDIDSSLENQLPFQVLELLTSLKSRHKNLITMMDDIWDVMKSRQSRRLDKKKFTKLLDNTRRVSETMQPRHRLDYLWLRANEPNQSDDTPRHSVKLDILDFYHSFRSISELKAKGIHARRSSSHPTRAFRFKSFFFFGVLEVPPLVLDPEYIIYISNQIAYECTPNNPNNQPTMAFINFMKSLINSAEDVKELRSKNILFSTYSSDEEVVKMFSSIPTFGLEDFSIYDDVKERIQKHYNSKAKTWIAELIHNYFNSPWTFIAFVATTSLVALSFLQTYFTIFPRSSK